MRKVWTALRINEYFTRHIQDKHIFITAIIGVVEIETGKVTFVRAGHNNPYYLSADLELKEINTKGIGIGLTRNNNVFKNALEKYELQLESGDYLILYTDGVVEATRIKNQVEEQFGEQRLEEILENNKNSRPLQLMNTITSEVNKFYEGQPYNDDLTLFILRRK